MPPRSKRQRKQKDRVSLKGKQRATGPEALDADNDPNALILPSKADSAAIAEADGTAAPHEEAPQPQKKLSKSQQRKLRKVQEEKERREKRAEIFDALSKHQLVGDQLGLLRPASARGQKETKKEGLRRALQLHRAGVDMPSDSRLFKRRRDGALDDQEEEEQEEEEESLSGSDETDSEDERTVGGEPAAKRQQQSKTSENIRALGKWNDKPKPVSISSSSADEESDGSESKKEEGGAPKAKRAKTSTATELRSAVDQAKAEIGDAAIHIDEDDELTTSLASKAAAAAAAAAAVPQHIRSRVPRVVLIQRTPEIEDIRTNLPIVVMEQEIMESIAENDVIVLCGETGCGKTTQVPQFLYEAGYGSPLFPERAGAVGVTQPRRVAAVSTARRVAEELGSKIGDLVGYQVRYDKKLSSSSSLKFMTDGILLREVQEDFLLRKYSAIIVDEAHERSLNTDILLGMLSRIVTLRRTMFEQQQRGQEQQNGRGEISLGGIFPLKLIIMSATLRTEDFVGNTKLFSRPPPVVSVPARQYPVTVHFSRKTELHDYVGAAHKKVCQIHRNLPPGGVLIFLTGQREVEYLCRKLRQTFAPKKAKQQWKKGKKEKIDGNGGGYNDKTALKMDEHVLLKSLKGQADEDGDQEDGDDDDDEASGLGGVSGGSWSGAGEDAAEADAAAAVDEAFLLSALDDERGGAADRDDFENAENADEGSGDEEEVVILGGEGFTAEQIAEAEENFNQQLGGVEAAAAAAATNLNSLTAVAADAAKQMKILKIGKEDEEGPVHVLPLYAMLPPAQQARVFQAAPPGARLIIVATNVAETSLTIPGIRYVVDAGRSKQRLLENASGLARFEVRWVSKASAEQRAGRAGRTGPGHCYRLFSSAHYNDTFPQHTPPEIVNTALEGVALSLKALGVDKVANFPFPTPPEPALLSAAEQCLVALGALDPVSGRLTTLGVAMAKYPISPRHSRMLLEAMRGINAAEELLLAKNYGSSSQRKTKKDEKSKGSLQKVTPEEVLRYAEGLAAVLSVESPFINLGTIGNEDDEKKTASEKHKDDEGKGAEDRAQKAEDAALKEVNKKTRESARLAHARLRVPESDALSALCALCAFEAAGESETFCRNNHLLFKNLREAAALRKQLSRIVAAQRSPTVSEIHSTSSPPSAPPPLPVLEALRRAVAAGWGDHVARRVRSLEHVQGHHSTGKRNKRAVRYKSCTASLQEDIFLHPNSALHSSFPDFVVYSEIVRTVKRPYMAGLTAVEPRWLATAATPLCNFSTPLLDPPPFYSPAVDTVLCWQDVTFGSFDWPLPKHAATHPELSERCAVFAAALLEGKILHKFTDLKQYMAAPPSMAAKPEMRVHRRVADLISALEKGKIDSKLSLAAAWKKDTTYLKKELEAWMQKGAAKKLEAVWKDLIASVSAT